MKQKIPILKVVAWTIIGLWFTRPRIFDLLNIDFASIEIARNFRQLWLIFIPLSIAILIVKSWKNNTSIERKTIGLAAGILSSFCFIIVLNFFLGFCGWQFSDALYKHKTENTEIKDRILDCGAGDSNPSHQLVETYPVGKYLIKYSEIKEEDIDENKWIQK